ncbi:MAG: SlyX family protein [Xanthomonadales bacterium]|nr:SlyX family protein [Xanthomonadales bacterium]
MTATINIKGDAEQRLSEVEIKLTFLDNTVSDLATVDAQRSQRLNAIERVLVDIRAELNSLRMAIGHDARDEPPPPHY